jgi:hypothetical protein
MWLVFPKTLFSGLQTRFHSVQYCCTPHCQHGAALHSPATAPAMGFESDLKALLSSRRGGRTLHVGLARPDQLKQQLAGGAAGGVWWACPGQVTYVQPLWQS